ncbi:MAG: response regulator transcription factor [Beijerinckiaceae bacterium]
MLVFVDDREIVCDAYSSAFMNDGLSTLRFEPDEFLAWLSDASSVDLQSIEAFIIGHGVGMTRWPSVIRERSNAPILALIDTPSLEQTVELFAVGVDDVVRKPVHAREIVARIGAIRRRIQPAEVKTSQKSVVAFFDGRDPEVNGRVFTLPRRERRILEFFIANADKRVSKAQIFNAVYGLFEDSVDESVIESHISKLRKKLRGRLGYDPIDAKRYLGYLYSSRPQMGQTARGKDACSYPDANGVSTFNLEAA